MGSRSRRDAFSIENHNHTMSSLAANEIRRLSSTAPCPYHAAVLATDFRQSGSQSATFTREMLQYTPPLTLTQDWCIGSSASSGCTCASSGGPGGDNMSREIDAIIRASKVAAAANPIPPRNDK